MNKTKFLALVLVMAMVLTFGVAGCGDTGTVSSAPAASETPAETAAPAPATPAPADSAAEGSALEGNATEAETVGDPMEAMAEEFITYPLEGDNTVTMWYYEPPYVQFVETNMDFNALSAAEEATGVHLEIQGVGSASAGEQFNLLVASGDMPDLIPAREYYTGGLSKAYEEDIIVDINEYVDEFMPNYAAVFETLAETTQKDTLTDGKMLAFSTINDGSYSGQGLITRGDWLEAQGIEFSGNLIGLDEFTDMLRTFHEAYDTPYTYMMTDGTMPLEAAFDTEIPALQSDGFMTFITSAIFRKGDEVMSGWVTDEYREYLEWVLQMMDEGVLYKDFLAVPTDRGEQNTAQGTGQCAVWSANADKMEEIYGYTDDPNFKVAAVPNITKDPSQPYVWQQDQSLVSTQNGFSMSTSCQQPELVCQWMNYFWTTDGYYMANYGVEGESLKFEGETPVFDWETPVTATGANAPNAEMALELFTMKRFVSFYADNDRLLPTFPESALAAVELWTLDATDDRFYPTTLENGFTTEENEAIAEYEGDLLTYTAEECLKFLTGASELNDANWDAYVSTCEDMGINEIIDVYQTAYDQHLAGER